MNQIHKLNIGIIGGGQLGKMILSESNRMSLNISVLDSNKNSPCRNLTNNFFVGDLNNYNDVLEFGKKCDIITFEIEHINADALTELQKIGKKFTQNLRLYQSFKISQSKRNFILKTISQLVSLNSIVILMNLITM